jgi:hypothetical protein
VRGEVRAVIRSMPYDRWNSGALHLPGRVGGMNSLAYGELLSDLLEEVADD